MKKSILFTGIILSLVFSTSYGGGYNVGDAASDFSLKNVDGKTISLKDYKDAKGFIVIFTCNDCPFVIAWEDRMIELDKKYKSKGYPVIAINPNDDQASKGDTWDLMKKRAKDKGFTFPYLKDETQEVYKKYGATRTPHVYLLKKESDKLVVKYIGAIDDNHKDASAVKQPYLSNAIDALLAGKAPDPNFTKAIGCTIKTK